MTRSSAGGTRRAEPAGLGGPDGAGPGGMGTDGGGQSTTDVALGANAP